MFKIKINKKEAIKASFFTQKIFTALYPDNGKPLQP